MLSVSTILGHAALSQLCAIRSDRCCDVICLGGKMELGTRAEQPLSSPASYFHCFLLTKSPPHNLHFNQHCHCLSTFTEKNLREEPVLPSIYIWKDQITSRLWLEAAGSPVMTFWGHVESRPVVKVRAWILLMEDNTNICVCIHTHVNTCHLCFWFNDSDCRKRWHPTVTYQ